MKSTIFHHHLYHHCHCHRPRHHYHYHRHRGCLGLLLRAAIGRWVSLSEAGGTRKGFGAQPQEGAADLPLRYFFGTIFLQLPFVVHRIEKNWISSAPDFLIWEESRFSSKSIPWCTWIKPSCKELHLSLLFEPLPVNGPAARKYAGASWYRYREMKMLQTSFQLSIGRDHLAQPKCDFSPKRVSVLRLGLNLCF